MKTSWVRRIDTTLRHHHKSCLFQKLESSLWIRRRICNYLVGRHMDSSSYNDCKDHLPRTRHMSPSLRLNGFSALQRKNLQTLGSDRRKVCVHKANRKTNRKSLLESWWNKLCSSIWGWDWILLNEWRGVHKWDLTRWKIANFVSHFHPSTCIWEVFERGRNQIKVDRRCCIGSDRKRKHVFLWESASEGLGFD